MEREGTQKTEVQTPAAGEQIARMRRLYWSIGQPLTADIVEDLNLYLGKALYTDAGADAENVEKRLLQG